MRTKMVRPDTKGRVMLGHLTDGVSRFSITIGKDNIIILRPFVEIPADEKWLFENETALKKVKQGLKEAKLGHLIRRESFAKYAKDDSK